MGVTHDATREEIKEAYKKLALEFHPDKSPERERAEQRKMTQKEKDALEKKFKEMSNAYQFLMDRFKKNDVQPPEHDRKPAKGSGFFFRGTKN